MKPTLLSLFAAGSLCFATALAQSSGSSGSSASSTTNSTSGNTNTATNTAPRAGNSITSPTTNPNAGQNMGASNATTSGAWVDRPAPGTPPAPNTTSTPTTTTVVTPPGTTETQVTTPGLRPPEAPLDTPATIPSGTDFTALDRDGDGLVTLSEFSLPSVAARRQADPRASSNGTATANGATGASPDSAALAAQFQQLDVNRDGLLTRDELNGTARPSTLP